MADDGSSLTETERKVRDELKKHLGDRATIRAVRQEADRISVHVVSPNHFAWTADVLEKVAPPLAGTTIQGIDINLTTWWPS